MHWRSFVWRLCNATHPTHARNITYVPALDGSEPQLHDGLTAKALTGNDCLNCCTWRVSWSPARSTCLNPSHPDLICTLTPYTSRMDPRLDDATDFGCETKLELLTTEGDGEIAFAREGHWTSIVPSGLRMYDCTPFGRRPRGKLFFSRRSYAVKFTEVAAAVAYAPWRIEAIKTRRRKWWLAISAAYEWDYFLGLYMIELRLMG